VDSFLKSVFYWCGCSLPMTNTIVSPQYLVQQEQIPLDCGIKCKAHLFLAGLMHRVIPLRDSFPHLFSCCSSPFTTMREERNENGWRLHVCRPFRLDEAMEWYYLSREIIQVQESMEEDVVCWCWEASGVYSSRLMYIPSPVAGSVVYAFQGSLANSNEGSTKGRGFP
jgi:hypothetical protein